MFYIVRKVHINDANDNISNSGRFRAEQARSQQMQCVFDYLIASPKEGRLARISPIFLCALFLLLS